MGINLLTFRTVLQLDPTSSNLETVGGKVILLEDRCYFLSSLAHQQPYI